MRVRTHARSTRTQATANAKHIEQHFRGPPGGGPQAADFSIWLLDLACTASMELPSGTSGGTYGYVCGNNRIVLKKTKKLLKVAEMSRIVANLAAENQALRQHG